MYLSFLGGFSNKRIIDKEARNFTVFNYLLILLGQSVWDVSELSE